MDGVNKYNNISSIILSGGKSSRFGQDKCDLVYNGDTFLNNQIKRLKSIGICDIIACGYRGNNCIAQVVDDSILKGPLSGIYFGLKTIKNDRAFVVSVDVPLLENNTILKLIECSYSVDNDIVVARHSGKVEPLIAIYKKTVYTKVYDILQGDKYSIMRLFDVSKVVFVDIDDDEQFLNVNYKDDYNKLMNNQLIYNQNTR